MPNSSKDNEKLKDLRIENEIKKMKLTMEHGAHFIEATNQELPPEIERLWLDRILKFEKNYANMKKVKIRDYINNPMLRLEKELDDSEITTELNKLQNILLQNELVVDSLSEVESREMYRFITEELLYSEIEDFRIEGMITHFIYEDFKPHHDYHLKWTAESFLRNLLDKKAELDFYDLADKIDTPNGVLLKHKVIDFLMGFRESYQEFEIREFAITSLNRTDDYSKITFEIKYNAIIEGIDEVKSFEGSGGFELNFCNDYWLISTFHFPGLVL